MNAFERDKCMHVIDKLISFPICYPFIAMIDPEKDGAPDYLDFVKEPMSLAEVKRKLLQNEYKTTEQYSRDVNLIWANARAYNGEGALFTDMALEAGHWFNKKMKMFPSSAQEEWTKKLQKTTKRFYNVLAHPPPELDPAGTLKIETPSDTETVSLDPIPATNNPESKENNNAPHV